MPPGNRRLPSLPMPPDALPVIVPATALGPQPPSGVGQIPRLPGAPPPGFIPQVTPVAPPPPHAIGGNPVGGDFEAQSSQFLPFIPNQQIPIYTTQKRWRGCDVYLEIPQGLPQEAPFNGVCIFSVFIFARSQQGSNTLVASGRIGPGNGGARPTFPGNPSAIWIASVRGIAQQFQIVVELATVFAFVHPPSTEQYRITTIASDECVDPPDKLGAILIGGPGDNIIQNGIRVGSPTTQAPSRLEVVGVTAINSSAAARYLHFYDSERLVLAGQSPIYCWPLGPGAGYGVTDEEFRYRCNQAPQLLASSTPDTTTIEADCFMQMQVR